MTSFASPASKGWKPAKTTKKGKEKCPAPKTRRESAAEKKKALKKRRADAAKKRAAATSKHKTAPKAKAPTHASWGGYPPAPKVNKHAAVSKSGKKKKTSAKQLAADKANAKKWAAAGAAAASHSAKARASASAKKKAIKTRASEHKKKRESSKRYRTVHAAHKACIVAHKHAGAHVHGSKHIKKVAKIAHMRVKNPPTAKQKAEWKRWAAAGSAAEHAKAVLRHEALGLPPLKGW